MANLSNYLTAISEAVYGEEVRGSIRDAIEAMNEESSNAMQFASDARDSASASATAARTSETNAAASAESAAITVNEFKESLLTHHAIFLPISDSRDTNLLDSNGNAIEGRVIFSDTEDLANVLILIEAVTNELERKASKIFFEKLVAEVATKASQTALNTLSGEVATKASQTALNTLSGEVATKASQTALNTLSGEVATKASQTALNTLSGEVATKASQTALNTLSGEVDLISESLKNTQVIEDEILDSEENCLQDSDGNEIIAVTSISDHFSCLERLLRAEISRINSGIQRLDNYAILDSSY